MTPHLDASAHWPERSDRLNEPYGGASTDLFDRATAAFNAHDIEALVELHTDDAEIVPTRYWLTPAGVSYHGSDGVRSLFTETFANAPRVRIEQHKTRVVGPWILTTLTLFEDEDAEPVELASLYTVRDDRIERAVGFSSEAEAEAAAATPPEDDVGAFELEMLRAVFEAAPDGIFLLDDEGRFRDCNDAGAQLVGIDRADFSKHSLSDFMRDGELDIGRAMFDRLHRDGDFNLRISITDVHGTSHPIDAHGRANLVPGLHLVLTHRVEPDGAPTRDPVLSPREREVLALLAAGMNAEQAAVKLTLSPFTVRTHIRNAKEKLGAHTGAQAIAIALRDREISF